MAVKGKAAINSLHGLSEGEIIQQEFLEQIDAYYASPESSFYDNRIERRFLEQKLRHMGFKPYPKDGLVTFGASGTNMCDRQIVFKNSKTKPEKSPDLASRGRQRRVGNAVVDFFQLDLVHMPKRLGSRARFRVAESVIDDNTEWLFEDAAQQRKVFEVPHPETGELVQFAITAKPDGILDYDGNRQLLFEYKTKASGIVAMNNKLDYSGAQEDHLRQVTAESLIFGINEGLLVYESTEKPSWFTDEDKKHVPKIRKTWKDGSPIPDVRPFYFRITEEDQQRLLSELAVQAQLVYDEEIREITVDMTQKCGFCNFRNHCKAILTDEEKAKLYEVEAAMAKTHMAGKYEHRNLVEYLKDVD